LLKQPRPCKLPQKPCQNWCAFIEDGLELQSQSRAVEITAEAVVEFSDVCAKLITAVVASVATVERTTLNGCVAFAHFFFNVNRMIL
jgi:hypothetical protein